MKSFKPWKMLVLVMSMLLVFTACGNPGSKDEAGPDSQGAGNKTNANANSSTPPDPLGKYPETVTVV